MINCKVQLEIQNDDGYKLKEFEYKYGLNQTVYLVDKCLFSNKYKIKKTEIVAFECTNVPSYRLLNGYCVIEESLFDDVDEAIKHCEILNKRRTYKV